MGVKNSALLEDGQYKELHTGIDSESGEVADVADASLESFWHDGQPAELSKGISVTTAQRFFDYIPRMVFLPWLRALTQKANDDGGKLKSLEEETIPGVDGRVKTLEEETIPGVAERLTTAEAAIDSEQKKTTLLLGTPWQPIVCTYLDNSTFDSTYDDVLEDPLFQYGGINAVLHIMKRNVALGKAEDDEDQRYFVFDASTKELLLLNAAECRQATMGERTPVASFAVLQNYDPESELAMSGKAVDEALEAFKKDHVPISAVDLWEEDGVLKVKYSNDSEAEIGSIKGETGEQGPQGEKGDSYILTEADKQEVANLVLAQFTDVSEVGL